MAGIASGSNRYQTEHPDRLITINRTDNVGNRGPSIRGTGWTQLERDDSHSKRWRGIVGTFIAALSGWDIHEVVWHLVDWPRGYTFWEKIRSDGLRPDYHLYGPPTGRFNSPTEFVLHAFFLFSDKENSRLGGCRCHLDTGRPQREINRVEFHYDDPVRDVRPRPPRHREDDGERYVGPHEALRPRSAAGGGNRSPEDILGILQSIGQVTKPEPAEDRTRDRKGGQKFRIGELIWASILPISHPTRRDLVIKFWPAIIRDHRVSPDVPPNLPKLHHSQRDYTYDEYDVMFLGVSHSAVMAEGELLPYQAHWWTPLLAEKLENAWPNVLPTSPDMPELVHFNPVEEIPSRTFSNALAPLALADAIACKMSDHYSLTDEWPFDITAIDGSTAHRYQGCWLGPERIWQRDYVRITKRRAELAGNTWYRDLLPPSPGAETRGIVMWVRYFDVETMGTYVAGPLYEIENNARGHLDMRRIDPLPPTGYGFRQITPDSSVRLPLSYLAGKYEYTTLASPLTSDIVSRRTIDGYRPTRQDHDEGDDERRMLALGSLVPGDQNAIEASQHWEGDRVDLLHHVEREVKDEYFLQWGA